MKSRNPNHTSNGHHPVWLLLAASLWMGSIGNAALWRALDSKAALAGPAGWGLAISLSLCITAVLVALGSLLTWRATLKPALIMLLLATAAGTHFMWTYGIVIDPTMMVNVLQTNSRESADLLTVRFGVTLLLLGVLPAWVVWRWPVRPMRWSRQLGHNLGFSVLGLVLAVLCMLAAFQPLASAMRNHKELRYLINPLNSLYAIGSVVAEPLRPAARAFVTLGEDAQLGPSYAGQTRPPLFVLVVGETARSDHFGLNGYARDTTPELAREGVTSLRQVRACGTSTAASLPCMFSHLGREAYAERDANHETLLDVLQRAGLAVLWIDNQSGCKGVCDRVARVDLASGADAPSCPGGECPDMVMLDGLDERIAALPEAARSKGVVLVLHQMGSHGPAYARRSPAAFKRFVPECLTATLQDCSPEQLVNAYDNSIAYTDHFLASTVRWLKARERQYDTSFMYLSDHGESLGEGNLYLHGLPYAIAPDAQTRVPWILWSSAGFAARQATGAGCPESLRETALSHDHLFHTVLGLMDVRTSAYQPGLDLRAGCQASVAQ